MKAKHIFLFLTFSLLISGCVEDYIYESEDVQLSLVQRQLYITASSLYYESKGGAQTITINSQNTPWELTGLPNWLSASATKGNGTVTITLTASENASVDESRAALLTFASTASDYQYVKTISISQPAAEVYITPSESAMSFIPSGESKMLTVSSNVEWTAEPSETWVTTSKSADGQLRITAEENLGTTRSATIYLKRKGTTTTVSTISVTQAEAGVTVSEEQVSFGPDGGEQAVSVDAEASWTAKRSDSWISGTYTESSVNIVVSANNSEDARSGYMYIYIGTIKKVAIPVYQEGIQYKTSAISIWMNSTIGERTFTFESNTGWSVLSKPDWLEVTPTNGAKGKTTLTVTPQDNPNTTQRSGSIVIGRDGFSGNKTVSVTQVGKTFGDLDSQMDFPNMGGNQLLTINTDGQWTASTATSWIHLSPQSGSGEETLMVTVDANPGKDERTGSIAVSVGNTTQTITVVQVGRYINISYDNLLTNSQPATIQLSVASNMEWSASSTSNWLTVSPTSGKGDATLTLTVADNPSVNSRTGSILFKTADEEKEISITQPGRTLSVSTTELTFAGSGGTSEPIVVMTDGTFTVTSSASWATIIQNENTFTVTTTANTDQERKATITVALTGLNDGESLSEIIYVFQEDPHEYVNLGLPSGTLWATCNIGASTPEEYGDYFAWGETTGYNSGKTNFSWSTYKYCNGSSSSMTKYCTDSSYGTVDNKTELELADDAAYVNWGSQWRMPSDEQFEELINSSYTTTKWTTQNGVNGRLITSKRNGNTLFLPAAGCRSGTWLFDAGSLGRYWSHALLASGPNFARRLYFDLSDIGTGSNYRCIGLSVRPVRVSQ